MKEGTKHISERRNLGRCALQGAALFVLLLSGSGWGALSQNLLIRVKCKDSFPPNPVTDLSAVQRPTEGEIRLFWTAPSDYENPVTATPPAVTTYEIRYAPFSVADMGGNTAAWWAAATLLPAPGTPTPGAPGSPEFATLSSLPAVTHYFGIRSRDVRGNVSTIDVNAATPGQQASAIPRGVRPAPVAGLAALANPDTSFNVDWHPVTVNEDGSPATDVADYVVRRSNTLTGPFNVTVSSGVGANSFSYNSVGVAAVEYLQVVARDATGNESDPAATNLLEVTPQGIIGQIALSPDGTVSRAYVPSTLMGELRSAGGDLLMRMTPNTDVNMNRDPRTLATYDVGIISPAQVVDKNFAFSRPAMSVVLQSTSPVTAGTVGVLWWNGSAWLKVGQADVDDINNTVSFRTALPGTYQVRTFAASTELTLNKANVFPRIFSPNGDGINDLVYFVIENPNGSPIDGKIYDMGGNEVSDIRLAGAGAPTADSLSWNGRDRHGDLVAAGVYIYLIKGEGKKMTGTIVVAK